MSHSIILQIFNISDILDFVLPRICVSCKFKLKEAEHIICNECYSLLETVTNERLQYEFQRKFLNEGIIRDFISLFIFKEDSIIKNIIHSFKYDQNFHIGKFFAQLIFSFNCEKLCAFGADYIVPIPLHHLRKAERGYNQAAEIAKHLSKKMDIKFKPNIIKRKKYTKSQTAFRLEERKVNIEGAFKFNNKFIVKDKKIILVDDVITTGATISECAKILMENNIKAVYAVSAAIAD